MDRLSNDDASVAITLGRMPQQLEVLSAGDDWTGVTSTQTRKRLQNRLNQRAYRRRKLQQLQQARVSATRVRELQPGSKPQETGSSPSRGCRLTLVETHRTLQQFIQQAYQDYLLSSPRPTALHMLLQVNVLNALRHNAGTLSISQESLCSDHSLSPFNHQGPYASWESAPPSLRPTPLQTATHHHPWIDLFPFPQLRDNVIRAAGSIDEDELCLDLVDIDENEKPNLIVWGSPSDPRAWEATVPFLRKWGFVLRGCRELLDATNHWRETRGEKRLVFEVA
ncbi:hypothetical protein F4818DRAFT_411113 [Hypoxylon cercidicola]|nr:hypothetical protein F4818DRAFT_411113 [Hypoxylon cercidicola]